jgi:hypothetical protein
MHAKWHREALRLEKCFTFPKKLSSANLAAIRCTHCLIEAATEQIFRIVREGPVASQMAPAMGMSETSTEEYTKNMRG